MTLLVKRLMEHYQISTRQLATAVGYSHTAVWKVANGRMPNMELGVRIAHALNVTVEELWPVQDLDVPDLTASLRNRLAR